MIAGESKQIILTFATGIISDLSVAGVKLKGKVYVDQQPFFSFSLDSADNPDIVATVHSDIKNVALIQISKDLSAKLPAYKGNLYVSYELVDYSNMQYSGRIQFDTLETATPPHAW